MTKFSLSLFLLFDYDYCFINLAMLPPLLFYTLWHWFSLVTAQIECLCETQRRVCVKETLRIIYKNLQNFEHPLNHFVLSSKILKWYKTVQKFYQGLKVFKPRKNFLSEFTQNFCEILRKIQNFATKTKQKKSTEDEIFRLSEEIFTFLNRRCTDLEILQVLRKMYTVMRFKPMTLEYESPSLNTRPGRPFLAFDFFQVFLRPYNEVNNKSSAAANVAAWEPKTFCKKIWKKLNRLFWR